MDERASRRRAITPSAAPSSTQRTDPHSGHRDAQVRAEYRARPTLVPGHWRTILVVAAAARRHSAIGIIVVRRRKPARSPTSRSELLETFAAQAVIAIENVRLFNETKEALEQQTVDQRNPAGNQQLADGRAAGVRRDRGKRRFTCSAA